MSYFWGTGNDWKNLPGTAHTDKQTPPLLLLYIGFHGTTCKILWMVNKTMKISCVSSTKQKTMFDHLLQTFLHTLEQQCFTYVQACK